MELAQMTIQAQYCDWLSHFCGKTRVHGACKVSCISHVMHLDTWSFAQKTNDLLHVRKYGLPLQKIGSSFAQFHYPIPSSSNTTI